MPGEGPLNARSRRRRIPPSASGALALALLAGCGPRDVGAPVQEDLLLEAAEPGPSWETPVRAAATDGPGLERATVLLERGRTALAEGRTGEAVGLFRAAADASPALSDWARLLEARARAEEGDGLGVEDALTPLPRDLVELRGWEPRFRLALVEGRLEDARALAESALLEQPGGDARADVELALAEVCAILEELACARSALLRVLAHAPAGVAAERATTRLEGLGAADAEHHRALLEAHLARGNLARARATVEAMRRTGGVTAEDVRRAELRETVALSRLRGEESVVTRLLATARSAPEADVRADAFLAAARVRMRQGRLGEASGLLEEGTRAAPTSPAAQEALFLLGDLDQDALRLAQARDRFREAVEVDPASEWGGEAAARLGTLLYQEGRLLEAAAVFEGYRQAHAEGWRFQQATFWAGRTYRRLGEGETARLRFAETDAVDPVGYYGMRAREEGGGPGTLSGIPEGPARSEDEAVLALGGALRVEALRRAGLGREADAERGRLHRFMGALPGGLHALGETYHERGRLLEAVRLGREIRRERGRWDLRLLAIVFPLPYAEEIVRHADGAGVDPALMAALIRQESLFQPHAVSPAGATGLMQLQTRTAQALAARARVSPLSSSTLRDPETNLRLGAVHLRDLLDRHTQRLDEVLVAYNAGSGRLDRWRSFPEHADPDQFLERIPYRETRDYIRVVLESVPVYEALYGTRWRRGGLPSLEE